MMAHPVSDFASRGCVHSLERSMARNAWWILPFLSFLGIADLIIAVLDWKPGLPMAFEVVYLCFEMMSLILLCLVSVPVLVFFCTHSKRTLKSQRQRELLLAWLFAIPLSFTAIIKSTISLILKAHGIHLIQLNYAGISLAAVLLAYDMVLCFFDMPSFEKIVQNTRVRNSNNHTRSSHRHNCMCSECTGIWPPPRVSHQDIDDDCRTTTTTSKDCELSEIVHSDVVTVLQDEQVVQVKYVTEDIIDEFGDATDLQMEMETSTLDSTDALGETILHTCTGDGCSSTPPFADWAFYWSITPRYS